MRIDILIATHNRAASLHRALDSLLGSNTAPLIEHSIVVVGNACTDETPQVVARWAERSGGRVRYLQEPVLGKSRAVNRGIAATNGEIIALADDDQLMGSEWIAAIHRTIEAGFDYVSGPVLGLWEASPPPWYDDRLRGVLSLFDGGETRFAQEPESPHEVFSAGNAAVTRAALERIGGLHPAFGKIAGRFSMCEDGELLLRLKRAGLRGAYDPCMKVWHQVPVARLTRRYFRHWHRGYGVSMAMLDTLHPRPVAYWLGIPRFLWRAMLEALPRMTIAALRHDLPGVFQQELRLWFMLGFLQGKYFARPPAPAPPFAP